MTLYKIVKSVLDVCRKKKSDYIPVKSCGSKREIKIDIVAIILSLIVVVVVFLIGHFIMQQVSKELNASQSPHPKSFEISGWGLNREVQEQLVD
jgi:hypothetical protein